MQQQANKRIPPPAQMPRVQQPQVGAAGANPMMAGYNMMTGGGQGGQLGGMNPQMIQAIQAIMKRNMAARAGQQQGPPAGLAQGYTTGGGGAPAGSGNGVQLPGGVPYTQSADLWGGGTATSPWPSNSGYQTTGDATYGYGIGGY
jgi:hypothetical protein